MKKRYVFVVLLLVLSISFMGCGKKQEDETSESAITVTVNTIDAETAMEMMASGDAYTLIDVRTQAEYDEGHIEGALLLPNDQLETLAPEQLTDKDAVILVYCRSGNRSAQASQLLVELGYTNVYDFGGIMDWPGDVVK